LKKLTELLKKEEGTSGIGDRPYKDLYIYLFKGIVPGEGERFLGDDFIGNWVEDDSSFLFFGKAADNEVDCLEKAHTELERVDSYHFTYEQWQGGGLESFQVDDFVVTPPWDKKDALDGPIQILLDPGVVFGNGLHPTTRDCLRAISYTHGQKPFKRVLDLGTGTGVLALAVALLGAEVVMAVDINPLCAKTAAKNAVLNDLSNIIRVAEGRAEDFIDEPADLVVANIHHAVIKRLLDSGGFSKAERFIISGLMRSQFRDVKAHLEMNQFVILREWDHDMTWFTCLAMKKN